MAKKVGSDIFDLGYFVTGSLTRTVAMAVVGNLPQNFKEEVYQGKHEILLSKVSTGVSILSNIGLGVGGAYLTKGDSGQPVDIYNLNLHGALVLYTIYSIVEGIVRGITLPTAEDTSGKISRISPGSLLGCAIYFPLHGLKEYLKLRYQESKKEAREGYP